jgi:hypothetical protein
MFDGYNARRTMAYSMPDYVYSRSYAGGGHGTTGNAQTFGGAGFTIGPTAVDFTGPRPEANLRGKLMLCTKAFTLKMI